MSDSPDAMDFIFQVFHAILMSDSPDAMDFLFQIFHAIFFSGLQNSNKIVKMFIQFFSAKSFQCFYAQ